MNSYSFQHFLIPCLSDLQVAQLKELSKQPDIYERLTKSLAPNIWELDDVKKGLLCQVVIFTIYISITCLADLLILFSFSIYICFSWLMGNKCLNCSFLVAMR